MAGEKRQGESFMMEKENQLLFDAFTGVFCFAGSSVYVEWHWCSKRRDRKLDLWPV